MRQQFEEYLIGEGYSKVTPSGHPSTVYAYISAIDRVCEWERMSWDELVSKISIIICQYDIGGAKEDLGNTSHKTVINALKRFLDFSRSK